MTDDVFRGPEKAVINAVKTNLLMTIDHLKIFGESLGLSNDIVIAGGYFATAFVDEPFKDIDVFILNKNVQVYANLTDNSPIHEKWKIRDKDAGTYLDNPHIHGTALNEGTKVQYILTDYPDRRALLDHFDYRHCTVSYTPIDNKLYITRGAYDDIRNKTLTTNGTNRPKAWREQKFFKRGWRYPIKDNVTQPVDAITKDYSLSSNDGLGDSYRGIINSALNNMLNNLSKTKSTDDKLVDPYLQTK